jgi:hypothetical protein
MRKDIEAGPLSPLVNAAPRFQTKVVDWKRRGRLKPGRPPKRGTLVLSVRVPSHIYDAYIKAAYHAGEDVRAVLAAILTHYAPTG